ncbi:MAG: lipopolysaccharide assembly protein LapA domain-containing protein [Phycisphaerales bacterium]
MHKAKLVGIAIAVIIVLVLILQNTAQVETRILFATVTMPRALLLAVTALLGMVAGLLIGVSRNKTRSPE